MPMTFKLSFSFKLLAVVLSLAIVFVSLPLSAFAGDNGSVALESLEDENSLSTSTNADIFEMDDLRTADAKTFRLTDGSFYTANYNTGIHEQDEDGNWINIDNRLHQNGGFISTKNGRYTFQEKTAIDVPLFSLNNGNYRIAFTLDRVLPDISASFQNQKTKYEPDADPLEILTTLDAIRSTVLYEDILPETDVEYVLYGSKVKESLILNTPPTETEYSFVLALEGLTAYLENDAVLLQDTLTGETEYILPAPVMWDSEYSFSSEIEIELEVLEEDRYRIRYVPDEEWLHSPDRVYPVTIDPSIYSNSSNVIDLDVSTANPNRSSPGDTSVFVSNIWRAYWQTTALPELPSHAYITNASIRMNCYTSTELNGYVGVYDVLSGWDATLTWQDVVNGAAGVPAETFSDYQRVYTISTDGQSYYLPQSEYTWNVTPIVRKWYAGENYGLMFQPANGSFTGTAMFRSNDYNTSSVRPQLMVTYVDMKGLEDYWSFTPMDAGFAGQAYINNATGNLVVNIPTLTSTDALMPVTPSLVYNLCMDFEEYKYPNVQTANTTSFTPRSFKLNLNETLIQKAYTNAEGNTAYCIIWADGDGTEHYFFPTSSGSMTYEDEDGLHLTISAGTSCTITDSDGNVKKFTMKTAPSGVESAWYLSRITDKSGNAVKISVNSSCAPTSIKMIPKNGSEIEQLRISYNSVGSPYAVWNPTSGEGVVFRYANSYGGSIGTGYGKYLKRVIRAHGGTTENAWLTFYNTNDVISTSQITVDAVAEYNYNYLGIITKISNTLSGYRLTFNVNSDKRVSVCQEYSISEDENGQKITYTYGTSSTVVRSSGKDDNYGTSDDLLTTYVHDSLGRTSSVYTTDLNKTQIYGASSGQYVSANDWNDGTGHYSPKAKNSLKSSVQGAQVSSNWARNGGFESGSLQYWSTTGQSSCNSNLTHKSWYSAEMKLTGSVSSSSIYQYVDLDKGDYALSLDINTHDLPTNVSVYLKAESQSNSAHSLVKQLSTNEYYATGGWVFASLDFSADPSSSGGKERFKISILMNGTVSSSTSIWIDNVMLSKTLGSSSYDMTKSGHFETNYGYTPSTFWKILDHESIPITVTDSGNGQFGDVLHIDAAFDEIEFVQQTVYQIPNDVKATFLQGSYVPPAETILYTVSGWGKGTGQSYTAGSNFCIRAKVNYCMSSGNHTTKSWDIDFDRGSEDWQYISGVIAAEETQSRIVESITILLMYNGHQGEGYFDNISFIRSDSGSSVYEYGSSLGHLSVARNGNGTLEYSYFNNDGNKVSQILNQGSKTIETYTYDNCGRLSTEKVWKYTGVYGLNMTPTELNSTEYTYDAYGLVTQVLTTDSEDNNIKTRTTSEYATSSSSHIFGAILKETDALGNTTQYFYNTSNGRLNAAFSPSGNGVCYIYDGMGNLTEVLPAAVNSQGQYTGITGWTDVQYGYDPNTKRLSSITTFAEAGRTTTYTFSYDGFGNPDETKVGARTLAAYTYNDNNGKLDTLVYGNGLNVRYEYDAVDRISEIKYRNGSSGSFTTVYSYTYNAAGQLYSIEDHESGEVTLYKYDAAGKMIGSYVCDSSTDLNKYGSTVYYDDQSRVSSAYYSFDYPYSGGTTYDSTHYQYSYNNVGIISKIQTSGSSITGTISPEYDNLGRTKTRELDYDDSGSNAFYNKLTYSYASNGTYTSGRVSQVDSVVRKGANTSTLSSSTYKYTYDQNGNITQIKDSGNTVQYSYTYGAQGQLLRENNRPLNQSYTYSYDAAGNILSKTTYAFTTGTLGTATGTVNYTYGDNSWGDLLTGYNGTTVSYDTIGNPTSVGSVQLIWKGRKLTDYRQNTYTNLHFTYNADGIRTSKTDSYGPHSARHEYILNGTQIVKETVFVDGSESYTLIYLYDETGSPVGFRYRTPSYDQGVFDGYFFEKNIQGDIVGIWNQNGTKVVAYTYDAWGKVTASGTDAGGIGAKNPFRYRGYYYDTETGFYYLQTRYYNPVWGRFINADGQLNDELLGYNSFSYCDNNPISFIDPFGTLAYPGEIHNAVERRIAWDNILYREQTIQLYSCPHSVGGISLGSFWGRADLISPSGEVWEIKRNKSWQIERGKKQIKRYLEGTWKNNPEQDLKEGGYLPGGSFVYKSGAFEYDVSYHYVGDGVIAYDYTTKPDWDKVAQEALAVSVLGIMIFLTIYSDGIALPGLAYSIEKVVEAFS